MAFVVAAATGCGASTGSGGAQGCTAMAAPPGIDVEVAPKVAERVGDTARVRACWGGNCRTREVQLRPTTTAVSTSCTSDEPSGQCSAEARETGGKSGFARFAELPAAPVRTTLTLTAQDGATVVERTLRVVPEETYPNGPECGASGNQADLTVDRNGQVREG